MPSTAPPAISGVPSLVGTNDTTPIQPFKNVVIGAAGTSDLVVVTIADSAIQDGSLGEVNNTSGATIVAFGASYTITGTAAQDTAAIDALTFAPVAGQDGQTVLSFTATDNGAISASPSPTTLLTITASPTTTPPTITGVPGSATTNDTTPITPFASVVVGAAGTNDLVTVTIGNSAPAFGTVGESGTTSGATIVPFGTALTITGTAAEDTAAIDALSFTPVAGSDGQTAFTFTTTDNGVGSAVTPATIVTTTPTVIITTPPTITGVPGAASTNDTTPIKPFGGVVVGGGAAGDRVTVTIENAAPAFGTLVETNTTSGATIIPFGTSIAITGSAAQDTAAIDALTFTPVAGQDGQTTFTFLATDKNVISTTAPTTIVTTTATAVTHAAPTITGVPTSVGTNDETPIQPFKSVVFGAYSPTLTVLVALGTSSLANGTLNGGTPQNDVYVFTGTAAQDTAAVEALTFTPTPHQVAPGQTVQTILAFSAFDGTLSSVNVPATVVTTIAVNDAPVISGTLAGQTTTDFASITPFKNASITDVDVGVSDSLTIKLENGTTPTDANGTLSGAGLTKTGVGVYTLAAATPATLTSELRALSFTPTAAEVAAGKTVTTTFALTASQTAGGTTVTATDATTSVVVTALNEINGPWGGFACLNGTPGADVITAHGYYNIINGNGGADIINAGSGLAYVSLGAGNATVTLGGGCNFVTGTTGNVTVTGAPGGGTKVTLGTGNDVVNIGGSGDTILLGNGNNMVTATGGAAFIATGSGNDVIVIGGGWNTVNAGGGTNAIGGGTGNNTFILPTAGQGVDTITGFTETNGDVLNVQAALAATGWNGQLSTLGNYIHAVPTPGSANSTSITVSPSGSGPATTIAVLSGSGLLAGGDLLAHNSVIL